MLWAVSQAAPLRRVTVPRPKLWHGTSMKILFVEPNLKLWIGHDLQGGHHVFSICCRNPPGDLIVFGKREYF